MTLSIDLIRTSLYSPVVQQQRKRLTSEFTKNILNFGPAANVNEVMLRARKKFNLPFIHRLIDRFFYHGEKQKALEYLFFLCIADAFYAAETLYHSPGTCSVDYHCDDDNTDYLRSDVEKTLGTMRFSGNQLSREIYSIEECASMALNALYELTHDKNAFLKSFRVHLDQVRVSGDRLVIQPSTRVFAGAKIILNEGGNEQMAFNICSWDVRSGKEDFNFSLIERSAKERLADDLQYYQSCCQELSSARYAYIKAEEELESIHDRLHEVHPQQAIRLTDKIANLMTAADQPDIEGFASPEKTPSHTSPPLSEEKDLEKAEIRMACKCEALEGELSRAVQKRCAAASVYSEHLQAINLLMADMNHCEFPEEEGVRNDQAKQHSPDEDNVTPAVKNIQYSYAFKTSKTGSSLRENSQSYALSSWLAEREQYAPSVAHAIKKATKYTRRAQECLSVAESRLTTVCPLFDAGNGEGDHTANGDDGNAQTPEFQHNEETARRNDSFLKAAFAARTAISKADVAVSMLSHQVDKMNRDGFVILRKLHPSLYDFKTDQFRDITGALHQVGKQDEYASGTPDACSFVSKVQELKNRYQVIGDVSGQILSEYTPVKTPPVKTPPVKNVAELKNSIPAFRGGSDLTSSTP